MGSVGRSIEERRMRTEMQQRESDVRSPGIVKVVKFCEITMELFLHEGKNWKTKFQAIVICNSTISMQSNETFHQ